MSTIQRQVPPPPVLRGSSDFEAWNTGLRAYLHSERLEYVLESAEHAGRASEIHTTDEHKKYLARAIILFSLSPDLSKALRGRLEDPELETPLVIYEAITEVIRWQDPPGATAHLRTLLLLEPDDSFVNFFHEFDTQLKRIAYCGFPLPDRLGLQLFIEALRKQYPRCSRDLEADADAGRLTFKLLRLNVSRGYRPEAEGQGRKKERQ